MNIIDPYEATPAGFHLRVERTLNGLGQERRHSRIGLRRAAVVAACLVLLGGTALALDHLGVLYFLTQRVWMGSPVDSSAVAQPTQQTCDSKLLSASVRDAYWDGETLSLSLVLEPKGDYAFYTETDRGQDGEHFDLIWWQGEILPFEEWKAGRPEMMLSLPRLMKGDEDITASWDWVQDGKGETMLVEGRCEALEAGGTFTLMLPCTAEGSQEHATLTFALPPMKKGEPD